MQLLHIATVILLVLKATGTITWGWLLCLLPSIIAIVVPLGFLMVTLIVGFIVALFS